MSAPRVFTIPPGVPFLPAFAAALRAGTIVPELVDPLALAATTIYVPTQRAGRALLRHLLDAYGGEAMLLPQIRPLGVVEESDGAFQPDDASPLVAMAPLTRRMLLAQLIAAWSHNLAHAIVVRDDPEAEAEAGEEPPLFASSFGATWKLAGMLAQLIDEMIVEGVDWRKLDVLGGGFDRYWQITLDFLDIAMAQWPALLAASNMADGARVQADAIGRQARRLREGRAPGPMIVLGSTGTNRAVAGLMAAIAASTQGAVILPGLDLDASDADFDSLGALDDDHNVTGATHPQAALARLLPVLQVTRRDVRTLSAPEPALAARLRFVSEALRPVDATADWRNWRRAAGDAGAAMALADIAAIEAADEREEALALALALRHALEDADTTAALVTPDRGLAARVKAELRRWDIDIDDSGGEPLAGTPAGSLALLALQAHVEGQTARPMLALLQHRLVTFDCEPATLAAAASALEIGVYRAVLPDMDAGHAEALIGAAKLAAKARHAHPAAAALTDEDWSCAEAVLARLQGALAEFAAPAPASPLGDWVARHMAVLARLAPQRAAADGAVWAELDSLFGELGAASLDTQRLDATDYFSLLASQMRESVVRVARPGHPRLKILGLLEARLLHADLVLLGGLDETVWPPAAAADAFLNRPMRAQLGLSTPERRIGQTAHDFVSAMGNRRVILSHAQKRDGKPTTPSRFLLRLQALAGAPWQDCVQRGDAWLEWARAADSVAAVVPMPPPQPCPPLELRPTRLAVTGIETLRHDPYALYADKILKLKPLDALDLEAGVRERGIILHEIFAAFAQAHPRGPLPSNAAAKLEALAQQAFASLLQNDAFRTFQGPVIAAAREQFLEFEAEARKASVTIHAEIDGKLDFALADGSTFTLTARADRISVDENDKCTLTDYKTGSVPKNKQILAGYSPQLTLEALILREGGFAPARNAAEIAALQHLKLGSGGSGDPVVVMPKDQTLIELIERHHEQLIALLNQFRLPATTYPSMPRPGIRLRYNPYDHLARIDEGAADDEGGGHE
ncbi:MAG: double-strand break repair protein AddB [Hyphomicrobiales bacterium]|nr:double-strand break repair protein AddB [Hyphomicrobiales bacterium]